MMPAPEFARQYDACLRHVLFEPDERYYSGDPVRLAGTLYGLYDKDTHIDRIVAMLSALEADRRGK